MTDPLGAGGRLRQVWRQHKDTPRTLGIAMAAIAMLFILGIVTAFNSARVGSMAQNPPAATASAPASPRTPPETTGSGSVNQPAPATPENTRP